MVNEIKTVKDFIDVIGDKNTGLVVVDFFTTWCGPCKMIAPFIEELSKKYSNVSFNKINADNNDVKLISEKCMISAFPTFCFFKKGQFIDSIKGANKKLLEDKIIEYSVVKNPDDEKENSE